MVTGIDLDQNEWVEGTGMYAFATIARAYNWPSPKSTKYEVGMLLKLFGRTNMKAIT